jgi:hypothetical protein
MTAVAGPILRCGTAGTVIKSYGCWRHRGRAKTWGFLLQSPAPHCLTGSWWLPCACFLIRHACLHDDHAGRRADCLCIQSPLRHVTL